MLAHAVLPPRELWSAWHVEPFALAAALAAGGLYALGLRATRLRVVSSARAACFGAGLILAAAAAMSPLHAAAEATFSGHMIQHLVLILAAAPLLIAGRPALVIGLALPMPARWAGWRLARAPVVAGALRLLRNPLTVVLSYATALWAWHLPGPYQRAVTDETVHGVEHAVFVAVALAFWSAVTRTGPRRRTSYVASMTVVLATMLHSTWLAAILTFGDLAYPLYAGRTAVWGIDPLLDQQLAGAIMWIPGTIAYFAVLGVLFVRWFRELDLRHERTPSTVGV